jgi:hypothetical protein
MDHALASHELGQLQHAEHPQDPEDADRDQIPTTREEERQVRGQHRQQIDDAVEAGGVLPGAGSREETEQVLDREHDREGPLCPAKGLPVAKGIPLDAVQHDDGHADQDREDQYDVERLARGRIVAEDHSPQPEAPVAAVPGAGSRIAAHRPVCSVLHSFWSTARMRIGPPGHSGRRGPSGGRARSRRGRHLFVIRPDPADCWPAT